MISGTLEPGWTRGRQRTGPGVDKSRDGRGPGTLAGARATESRLESRPSAGRRARTQSVAPQDGQGKSDGSLNF